MKKLLPLFLVLAVAAIAWKFWPEDERMQGDGLEAASHAVQTRLGPPGDAPGGPDPGPEAEPEAPVVVETPSPPSASEAPTTSGLRELDRWHRAPRRLESDLSVAPEFEEALDAFSTIWAGEAGAYAARLRIELPSAFGREFEGFAAAFAGEGVPGLERSLGASGARGPAWMAWTEALVEEALRRGLERTAGPALGRLLEAMDADDYPRARLLELQSYAATLRARVRDWLPQEDYKVVSGDSLDLIGTKYRKKGHMLRFGWMMEFNSRSSDRIRLDETLRIPLAPLHLLGLRSHCVLALYAGGTPIHLYEVSYGKPGFETPAGSFTLKEFLKEPVDYGLNPPVPYGHPKHRLGTRWISFLEDESYGIHGNNNRDQVGSHESAGCVRMINAEVEELFELVPRGAKVEIRP